MLCERELAPDRRVVPSVTVFLAGSECPFTCVFCDLWRQTLDGPTPAGAIPTQLDRALAELTALEGGSTIKLYNASNFFDSRAVPRSDWPGIAERLTVFERVVVECHPRLVGDSCLELAELLTGRLEVAMGLETAHTAALARLNKKMTLVDFDRAAGFLRRAGIGVRAFVLVGAPFVPAAETVEWSVRSVEHALGAGAEVVSLIPVRGGNGEMERLARRGDFRAPTLDDLEKAFDRSRRLGGGVVQADLWGIDRLTACPRCAPARIARLARLNLGVAEEDRIACDACSTIA